MAYTATACLATLSAAIGAGMVLRDGPRQIRPNLYTILLNPSDPAFSTAYGLAIDPFTWEHSLQQTNWQSTIIPRLRRDRISLQLAKAAARRNRDFNDSTRESELQNIECELESIRETERKQPVLFLSSINRQRLVDRLSRQPNEAVAILTTDPRDAICLTSTKTTGPMALAQSILQAGHPGTPLSMDISPTRYLYLHSPCISLCASLPAETATHLITPETLATSPLLPKCLILAPQTTAETNPSEPSANQTTAPTHPQDRPYTSYPPLPTGQPSQPPTPDPLPSSHFSPLTSHVAPWRRVIKDLLHLRRTSSPRQVQATREARQILQSFETRCRNLAATTLSDIPAYPMHWAENAKRIALLLHAASITTIPAPCTCTQSCNCPNPHNPESPADPSENHETPTIDPTTPLPAPESTHSSSEIRHSSFRSLAHSLHPLPDIPAATATTAVALMEWYAAHQLELIAQARHQLPLRRDPLLARVIDCIHSNGGQITLGELKHTRRITASQAKTLATHYPHLLTIIDPEPGKPGRPRTTISLATNPAQNAQKLPTLQQTTFPVHPVHPASPPDAQKPPPIPAPSSSSLEHFQPAPVQDGTQRGWEPSEHTEDQSYQHPPAQQS